VEPDANPVEAVRARLAMSENATPWHLPQKAVVGLSGAVSRKVIWDANVDQ
jgi:hypothetical protein